MLDFNFGWWLPAIIDQQLFLIKRTGGSNIFESISMPRYSVQLENTIEKGELEKLNLLCNGHFTLQDH